MTLIREVERKLPQELGIQWARQKVAHMELSLEHLYDFLDEQMMYAIAANVDVTGIPSYQIVAHTPIPSVVEMPVSYSCRLGCKEDHP